MVERPARQRSLEYDLVKRQSKITFITLSVILELLNYNVLYDAKTGDYVALISDHYQNYCSPSESLQKHSPYII